MTDKQLLRHVVLVLAQEQGKESAVAVRDMAVHSIQKVASMPFGFNGQLDLIGLPDHDAMGNMLDLSTLRAACSWDTCQDRHLDARNGSSLPTPLLSNLLKSDHFTVFSNGNESFKEFRSVGRQSWCSQLVSGLQFTPNANYMSCVVWSSCKCSSCCSFP